MSVKRLEKSAIDIINENYGILIESRSIFGQTLKRAHDKGLISELPNHFDIGKENIVVIELGGNDADYDWKAVSASPNEKHFSKTKVGEFKQILKESILFLQSHGAKVIVCSIFPMDSKRYFDSVIKVQANAENVLLFLENDIMNLSRHQEVFNNAIQTIVKETGCAFLDYRSRILLKNDFLSYICEDGIHPNEKGHEYIAKVASDFIENFSFKSWNFLQKWYNVDMKLIRREQEDYYFNLIAKTALKKKKAVKFDEGFYDILKSRNPEIAQMIETNCTSGYCYFYSLLLAKLLPSSTRKKGILRNLTSNINDCYMDYFYHAFVEQGDFVYDTSSKMIFDKEYYYSAYDVRVDDIVPAKDLQNSALFEYLLRESISERPSLKGRLEKVLENQKMSENETEKE